MKLMFTPAATEKGITFAPERQNIINKPSKLTRIVFVTNTIKKFLSFNVFASNLSSANTEKRAGKTKQINSTITTPKVK